MSRPIHFPLAMDRNRRFLVSQNRHGHWVAREEHGLIEGVFRSQRDAVRFALFETGNPDTVVVIGVDRGDPAALH